MNYDIFLKVLTYLNKDKLFYILNLYNFEIQNIILNDLCKYENLNFDLLNQKNLNFISLFQLHHFTSYKMKENDIYEFHGKLLNNNEYIPYKKVILEVNQSILQHKTIKFRNVNFRIDSNFIYENDILIHNIQKIETKYVDNDDFISIEFIPYNKGNIIGKKVEIATSIYRSIVISFTNIEKNEREFYYDTSFQEIFKLEDLYKKYPILFNPTIDNLIQFENEILNQK